MRTLFHPQMKDVQLSTVFYALSDPVRLGIVARLGRENELSCGGFGGDSPKSTMSHHFKVLRESGVIRTRIEGTQRFISLRHEELEKRFPGLLRAVLANAEPSDPCMDLSPSSPSPPQP
ncbi:ArsR/SmtB family transcription factor [Paenibacillus flagellatus]|uniref:Transcriptional regulator n=1 Tax=Paenibacillus flagellatus TaxID=2211139 RepID=A0A2V5JX59_9BACL|nr:metalloregulator ArsR/SmtB family transcription factor [Paenibacillus flagellatus]PYI51429.1 transcriptional regulator [Paenibacillus flagellatus]